MNNKGQSTVHWGWMAVVMVIFLTCAWIYSANRPDQFQKGSEQNTTNRWALVELVFSPFNWQGCATLPTKHSPEVVKVTPVAVTKIPRGGSGW